MLTWGRLRRSPGLMVTLGGIAVAIVGVLLILSPDLFWEEIGLALIVIEVGGLIVIGGVWSLVTHLHDTAARGSILGLLLLPGTAVRTILGLGVVLFGIAILLVALLVH